MVNVVQYTIHGSYGYMKSYEIWDILNISWLAGFLASTVLSENEQGVNSQSPFLETQVVFKFHETILSFGELGSIGCSIFLLQEL